MSFKGKWKTFQIKDYSETLDKFRYCFMNDYTFVIIGGENQNVEEIEVKGFLIDLKEK